MTGGARAARLTGEILGFWARRTPRRPAVLCDGGELSYSALDRLANRFAHALSGLAPGARIVIMSRNRAEYPAIHFGAARSGHVLVHVSPRYTPGELAFVLKKTKAALLIADAGALGVFAAARKNLPPPPLVIALGDGNEGDHLRFADFIAGQPDTLPAVTIEPDDAFSVTYTGGTTGDPRGAVASHAGRLVSARAGVEDFGLEARDIVAVTTPLCHAAGLFTWYQSAAMAGAAAVLMAKWDAGEFIAAVERHRITAAFVVPAQLVMLLDCPDFDARRLASLRLLACGGAPATADTIARAEAVLPGCALARAYGSTETGHLSCQHPADRMVKAESLGRPGRHMEVAVLDGRGQPAARGEVGEIATRGRHVMLAYFDDPAGTADYFRSGDSWGWTGDMATVDKNGFITLVGRRDDVIISGGMNIYPAEIEKALARHKAVAECAVFGVADPLWGEVPAAAVVLRVGAKATETELTAFCARNVAPYKCITDIIFMDILPRTAAGKVRRHVLRNRHAGAMNTGGK